MMRSRFFFFIIAILFSFNACRKNENPDVFPQVPVNLAIRTTDPAYIDLSTVGGWEYVNGGSLGIIVYRKSQDEFSALDRHSPYNVKDRCIIEVDSSQITATDPCSGSQFLLIDGSVLNGPAASPMHAYQTSFDGKTLFISN